MGHGSSFCAKYLERIVKQLKKNRISQCKDCKAFVPFIIFHTYYFHTNLSLCWVWQ